MATIKSIFQGIFGLKKDPNATTQDVAVIKVEDTNAGIVLQPNGTGAIMAQVPDGTAAGGNARGQYAVDLQMSRNFAYQVASGVASTISGGTGNRAIGNYSTIVGGSACTASGQYSLSGGLGAEVSNYGGVCFGNANTNNSYGGVVSGGQNNTAGSSDYVVVGGGRSNTASSQHSTVSGGQSNTASTGTHATVVGGSGNTASGQYSVAGGRSNTASGNQSFAVGGRSNTTSASSSTTLATEYSSATGYCSAVIGAYNSTAASSYSAIIGGDLGRTYLLGQVATGVRFSDGKLAQSSTVQAYNEQALSSSGTMNLSLDGTGTTNLIASPGASFARNVTVKWIAVCKSAGSGTTVVRETAIGTDVFMFRYDSGTITPYISTVTSVQSFAETSMTGAACSYSASSSNLIITFTAPSTANNTTFKVLAKVELVEIQP
jgi:hypothetical protein